ncbi:hypothetical protein GPLA_0401 [Paraglaciecola polaris LMG 21857]|uniref:Uncharacterized protein n=1 Tax=Paraglaciecola polaris LMG 21857 TaxID=1129793 RepID=K7A7B5_9ALTE|nr:hypothetical protein GPLA_0401 [Paraglaciecola polaris LMG 21857]
MQKLRGANTGKILCIKTKELKRGVVKNTYILRLSKRHQKRLISNFILMISAI